MVLLLEPGIPGSCGEAARVEHHSTNVCKEAFLFIIRVTAMCKMPSGYLAFGLRQVSVGVCDRTQRVSVVWHSAQKGAACLVAVCAVMLMGR